MKNKRGTVHAETYKKKDANFTFPNDGIHVSLNSIIKVLHTECLTDEKRWQSYTH